MASGLVCGFSCVVTFLFYIGCRICDRNSRRCRNSCKCSAGTSIRGAHSNIDFWRGSCSVRTHRFIDFGNLIISFYLPYITYNFSILEIKQFIYRMAVENRLSLKVSINRQRCICFAHFYRIRGKTNMLVFLLAARKHIFFQLNNKE